MNIPSLPLPPQRLERLVVQCHIPTLAARAIKLETIKRRAREAGILRATIRFARDHIDHPETQVTTHIDVARFLVDRLRTVGVTARRGGGPSKSAVVIACGEAAARLSAAIDAALDAAAHALDHASLSPSAGHVLTMREAGTP